MTARKPVPKPITEMIDAIQARASIPKRQVIEHTKLFKAELQLQRSLANDEMAVLDLALETAAQERDAAMDAAYRQHDLETVAAFNKREGTKALASQRFDAIRAEVDAERADLAKKLDGIEAAFSAVEPKPALSVVAAQ